MNTKKSGFTLAEVLITLSIMGIIAVISISGVIQKISDIQTVTKVKRIYALLDNALQQMYAFEGNPYSWDWPNKNNSIAFRDEDNNNYFANKLTNYLLVSKYCGSDKGCFPQNTKLTYGTGKYGCYKPFAYNGTGVDPCYNNWTDFYNYGKMILKNGMSLSIDVNLIKKINYYGNYIGTIRVDVNGAKGPNQNGIDLFYFVFNENGLYLNHRGSGGWSPDILSSNYCSKDNGSSYRNGISCSTWILKHNNMDYKYRDISNEW